MVKYSQCGAFYDNTFDLVLQIQILTKNNYGIISFPIKMQIQKLYDNNF